MPRSATIARPPYSPHRLAPEDIVVWNWPLRDHGLQSWATLLLMAAAASIVWGLSHNPWTTGVVGCSLVISAWRLWLPVRWGLGLTGVSQSVLGFKRRIPWMAIARFELQSDGVWLFVDREASVWRASFVEYGRQQAGVRAIVEYYLGRWTSADSTQSVVANPKPGEVPCRTERLP